MLDGERNAVTALLTEIRDLLIPVADHYADEYEQRQTARRAAARAKVADLISTAKRRAAWDLADGTLSQREISLKAKLAEGATSQFFKTLRELDAVEGDMPKRKVEA